MRKSLKIPKVKKSDSEQSLAQKYKLTPCKEQIETLIKWGGIVRFLSNLAKEEREIRYQQNKNRPENLREYINYQSQQNFLPELKTIEGYGFLKEIPAQVAQQSLAKLDLSFQKFFKNGFGYPRWKTKALNGVHLRFPDSKQFEVTFLNKNNAEVDLPKIGKIRFKTGGRKIPAKSRIRSCTIIGDSSGTEFSISFNIGIDLTVFQKNIPINNGEAIGVDRGIAIAMQLSTDTNFIFPQEQVKYLENKLKKAQRKLAKQKAPTRKDLSHKAANYKKQQLKIKKIHTKIKNIRLDFNHKATTQMAKNHSLIVLENLKLKNMTKSAKGTLEKPGKNIAAKSGLNRALLRVGLGMQAEMFKYKCEWYGSKLIFVDPKNSSRECSNCGYTHKKNRKTQSIFSCLKCGHTENADLNASKVILARGHRVLACGEDAPVVPSLGTIKKFSKIQKWKEPGTSDLELP